MQYALDPNDQADPTVLWHRQGAPEHARPAENDHASHASALCDRLLEKPDMYQDEMLVFLWDEFGTLVTTFSVSRVLASIGWSMKAVRRIAQEGNADLRDLFLHNLSAFRSYHLVYIDESGCDKRVGFRRTGWLPVGVTPVQIATLHRDRRYQILPAYA